MDTYMDMMAELCDADEEIRGNWFLAQPWGSRGAMVVWLNDGRIYKVQKVGDKFIKQPLTKEDVRRKFSESHRTGIRNPNANQ